MAEWIVEIKDGKFPIGKMSELVRCKDCRYRENFPTLDDTEALYCRLHTISNWFWAVKPQDFCSRGERTRWKNDEETEGLYSQSEAEDKHKV